MAETSVARVNPCLGASLEQLLEALEARASMIPDANGHLAEVSQEACKAVFVIDLTQHELAKGKGRGRGKEGEPGYEAPGTPFETVKLVPMSDPEGRETWGLKLRLDKLAGAPVSPAATLLAGHVYTGEFRAKVTGNFVTVATDARGNVKPKAERTERVKFDPFAARPSAAEKAANEALADAAADKRAERTAKAAG